MDHVTLEKQNCPHSWHTRQMIHKPHTANAGKRTQTKKAQKGGGPFKKSCRVIEWTICLSHSKRANRVEPVGNSGVIPAAVLTFTIKLRPWPSERMLIGPAVFIQNIRWKIFRMNLWDFRSKLSENTLLYKTVVNISNDRFPVSWNRVWQKTKTKKKKPTFSNACRGWWRWCICWGFHLRFDSDVLGGMSVFALLVIMTELN